MKFDEVAPKCSFITPVPWCRPHDHRCVAEKHVSRSHR
ncbi:hypothetical protein MKQ70_33795 [Chitinophaga sedimenti]|nr:hypothetical protein [Chitinophaga sedimenti]